LLVVPATLVGDPLVTSARQALLAAGAEAVLVAVEEGEGDRKNIAARIDAELAGRPAHADQPADADRPGRIVTGVLSLLGLATGRHPRRPALPWLHPASLALVQALEDADLGARVWMITRGAVSTAPDDAVTDPDQALLWGLGAIVGVESPQTWGGLVDLEAGADPDWTAILGVLAGPGPDRELETAVRRGRVLGRRLVPAPLEGSGPASPWTPTGTVLITGATGALGGHVARWLAGRGAEHLLLVSRRGEQAPGAQELRAELSVLGTSVSFVAADVADRAQVAEVLAAVPAQYPLRAVMHAAAALDDAMLGALTLDQLERAGGAKVDGARHLHELTAGLELDAFVLFSSVAGVCGVAGQGNYAPGNAFLDALVAYRRARGLPGTAIAWGHWAGGGIAAPEIEEKLGRQGLTMLQPEQAVTVLGQMLDHDETYLMVCEIDWSVLFQGRRHPLVRELTGGPEPKVVARRPAPAGERPPDGPGELRDQLAALPEGERSRLLVRLVRTEAARVQGHPGPDAIDPAKPFKEQGFDSLTAVELRNRLSAATGVRLPATLVFDHPTPVALTGHLLSELAPGAAAATSMLVHLDRLEAALADPGPAEVDAAGRAVLATRLEQLLGRLRADPGDDVAARFDAASDAELINLIGETFGIS
jgi:NADP-dependent 3-hydroxy acid dehydrogenase YdfG/acyl carrier protein